MHLNFYVSGDYNISYTTMLIQQIFNYLFIYFPELFHKHSANMLKVVAIGKVCDHSAVIWRNCVTVIRFTEVVLRCDWFKSLKDS